jgi:hypothetical protein
MGQRGGSEEAARSVGSAEGAARGQRDGAAMGQPWGSEEAARSVGSAEGAARGAAQWAARWAAMMQPIQSVFP